MSPSASDEANDEVAALYDWLSRYDRLRALLRHRPRAAPLPMHKALRLPEEQHWLYPSPLDAFYIDDLALAAADLLENPRVLDAGCGFGASVFHWYERRPGRYDGLTLSRVQWKVARREAGRRGLQDHCQFYLKSYDHPLPCTYDAIIVIEALVHSSSLRRTIANLARSLKPRSRLVLVEDMASPDLQPEIDPDARMLRECWSLTDLPSTCTYRALLAKHDFQVIEQQDHSEHVVTRSLAQLSRRAALYAVIRRALMLPGPRYVADALLGGLALERLYRRRLMSYRLLVGRKGS